MTDSDQLAFRTYGEREPVVFVLHGGPGAPGSVQPVAQRLGRTFRVVEPFQRRSAAGGPPLTVARHVADLDQLIRQIAAEDKPLLLGSSWGAMLALAYVAARPDATRALVLVGCGTFDESARAEFRARLERRTPPELRRQLDRLARSELTADERLRVTAELLLPVYSFDPIASDGMFAEVDARGHEQTWRDMIRLQKRGRYPAALAAIRQPVLMIHGDVDPHPGPATRDTLKRYLPQIEYHELSRCGHYPWLERHARDAFFSRVEGWIRR